MKFPTSDEVRAYMARYEVGLIEAKRSLTRDVMYAAVREAKTIDDLKGVLDTLIAKW